MHRTKLLVGLLAISFMGLSAGFASAQVPNITNDLSSSPKVSSSAIS